jgi:hypothetical protein
MARKSIDEQAETGEQKLQDSAAPQPSKS